MYKVLFNGGGEDKFSDLELLMDCLYSLDIEDAAEIYLNQEFCFGWCDGMRVEYPPLQYDRMN